MVAAAVSTTQALATPAANAAPCPDAEVIFARGTTELPGAGPTGEAFVNALRSQLGDKSLNVYAVDYPATTDFPTAVQGIADARAHILTTAANCPDTKLVLGGFSQGAAVMGFVTASVVPDGVTPADVPAPMPPDLADHVSAVALFGKPSARFMRVLNDPPVIVGPGYTTKSIDLCVDDDLVCDPHGRSFAAHNQYEADGLVTQGATFVAQKLQADWAAAAPAVTAPEAPAQQVSKPATEPKPATAPPTQHLAPAPDGLPGPAPGPLSPPRPTAPVV